MSILIAYATNHGCAEKCAEILNGKLSEKADLCNLKKGNAPDLSKYDKVIIGGSIYAGKIQKAVKEYCANNLNELKGKKLGFFICCMSVEEPAKAQLNSSFPSELLSIAAAKEVFGGGFTFSDMNFFEKFIIKMVAKSQKRTPVDTKKDISHLFDENINKFAQAMNNV